MADGAGAGIFEGIGEALGTVGDKLAERKKTKLQERDLQADSLAKQAQDIADNIVKVGGVDTDQGKVLQDQLKATMNKHNSLFEPHEQGHLVQRIQKLFGHQPGQPKIDPRSELKSESVLAAAKRPDYKTTKAGQLEQEGTDEEIQRRQNDLAQQLKTKNNEATVEWAKKHGISDDALQDLQATLAGVPASLLKPQRGNWETMTGTVDGKPFTFQRDKTTGQSMSIDNQDIPPEVLSKFVPTPKGAIQKNKQGWIMRDGKPLSIMLDANNQPIPGSENPDAIPPAALTGRISTGMFHFVDLDGNVHEVPETRTSVPLGMSGAGGGAATPPPASKPATGASNPAPGASKPGAPASNPPKTPGEAKDRILGNKGTPALTDARKEYDKAQGLMDLANQALKDPQPGTDKNLAVRLSREASSRFSIAEMDTLVKNYGIANSWEQWLNNQTSGKLPDEIRKQLVNIARANLQGAKGTFDAAKQPTNPVTPPGGKPGNPLGLNLPGL